MATAACRGLGWVLVRDFIFTFRVVIKITSNNGNNGNNNNNNNDDHNSNNNNMILYRVTTDCNTVPTASHSCWTTVGRMATAAAACMLPPLWATFFLLDDNSQTTVEYCSVQTGTCTGGV